MKVQKENITISSINKSNFVKAVIGQKRYIQRIKLYVISWEHVKTT